MKILILKSKGLGDVIRTSYILPGLFDKYFKPTIDWVTSYDAIDLLRFNPYIRRVIDKETNQGFIYQNKYDLVLSFDDEDDMLKLLSKTSYKKVIGAFYKNGEKGYDESSSEWFDMGLISKYGKRIADIKKKQNNKEHNQIFAKMLNIKIVEPIFYNSTSIENRIKEKFSTLYFNLGLNLSAGDRWKNKELPDDIVSDLIFHLGKVYINNKPIRLHLLGGKKEESRNELIATQCNSCCLSNWGGNNTILEFAAIIKNCDYIITSDSFALHLAISQKVRSLSYYCPTSAAEIGTFGTGDKLISLSKDYCSYNPNADNSTITVDRILEKLHANLEIQIV